MRCPYCNSENSKTLETRDSPENTTRRRRECINCNKRYTTYEYLETVELMVRKKDGELQRFDVNKIIRGLQKACEKRPVTMSQINELADKVRQDLMLKGTEEVASGEIGDLIMKYLKNVDRIAYIRFASVYKQFEEPEDFRQVTLGSEKTMKFVLKRDSKLEPFDQERITIAIWKAAKAVGGKDKEQAKRISDEVVALLNKQYGDDGVPTVEEVQDLVEKRLIENGHASTAKAYILYRKQHTDMRELAALLSSSDMVDQYLEVEDWRVKENSNMSYSLQGLNNYLSSTVIAKYWIARIYPQNIAEAHFSGDIHIHDLGVLGPYCVGWDVSDLLLSGFGGVSGKIESKPAKHFRTALGQVVNFFYTLTR